MLAVASLAQEKGKVFGFVIAYSLNKPSVVPASNTQVVLSAKIVYIILVKLWHYSYYVGVF